MLTAARIGATIVVKQPLGQPPELAGAVLDAGERRCRVASRRAAFDELRPGTALSSGGKRSLRPSCPAGALPPRA